MQLFARPITRKQKRSPFRRQKIGSETRLRAKLFNREYYDDENYSYAEWYRDQARKIVTRVVEHLNPKKDWVFLDVGCALGGTVEVLRKRGYEAYGVDVSHWCLEHSPVGKYLRFGSATELPCRDQSVDVVLCIDTFQYLTKEEAKKAAKELRRITRKALCFECITEEDRKFSDPEENPDAVRKHRSLFTKEEFIELFEKAGFSLKMKRFLPRTIEGSVMPDGSYYDYSFSFNAIFEPEKKF